MRTTDEHSPINKAVGIPEHLKYAEVVVGKVYECTICQERSFFDNAAEPDVDIAYLWAIEHSKTHGDGKTDYFVWGVSRIYVKI